jgi:hypothetical protein
LSRLEQVCPLSWIFHGNAQRLLAVDADSLASGIHTAQGIALLAVLSFLVGAIFAALALFKYRYRARWFYWVVVTAGILMLFAIPLGTVLGVLLLVYVSKRSAEFRPEQAGRSA